MLPIFSLPCELAAIESLKQLLVEGNPIRTIRRDVINVIYRLPK